MITLGYRVAENPILDYQEKPTHFCALGHAGEGYIISHTSYSCYCCFDFSDICSVSPRVQNLSSLVAVCRNNLSHNILFVMPQYELCRSGIAAFCHDQKYVWMDVVRGPWSLEPAFAPNCNYLFVTLVCQNYRKCL